MNKYKLTVVGFFLLVCIQLRASTYTSSVFNYDHYWQASSIIPMSANLQWIFYTNENEYLLKVLLNEREVKLPLSISSYSYYKWDEVKKYYASILAQMGTSVIADMHDYLLKVK